MSIEIDSTDEQGDPDAPKLLGKTYESGDTNLQTRVSMPVLLRIIAKRVENRLAANGSRPKNRE